MRKRMRAGRGSKAQFTRTAMKTKKINLGMNVSRGGRCF